MAENTPKTPYPADLERANGIINRLRTANYEPFGGADCNLLWAAIAELATLRAARRTKTTVVERASVEMKLTIIGDGPEVVERLAAAHESMARDLRETRDRFAKQPGALVGEAMAKERHDEALKRAAHELRAEVVLRLGAQNERERAREELRAEMRKYDAACQSLNNKHDELVAECDAHKQTRKAREHIAGLLTDTRRTLNNEREVVKRLAITIVDADHARAIITASEGFLGDLAAATAAGCKHRDRDEDQDKDGNWGDRCRACNVFIPYDDGK